MKLRLTLTPLLSLALLAALAFGAETPVPPEWALPGSATHQQVPPPKDFHRATVTVDQSIGIFQGQSDVGAALVPGQASYDPKTKSYTITSAGYNIWYQRDEFRFLWRKMSGDVSLAADITFPNPGGYDDRKVVLIVRQDLDDDAKEIMSGLHGAGLIHLADRPEKGADIKEEQRLKPAAGEYSPTGHTRLGLEKHGDEFTLYVGLNGGPMHPVGAPAKLHFDGPFYVGIGFTSHLPVTPDTAVVSHVVLKNKAGKVR